MRAVILFSILAIASTQDQNCDFTQNIQTGRTYFVYSPNHPQNYTPGVQCRWIATCPSGYNCRLDCNEIVLPQTPSCQMDRLLISKTGDPQLSSAETYCGVGSVTAISSAQRISIGLITARNSPGGRFMCQLTAQPAVPNPGSCKCGERKQNRIVGGQETGVNEYPMMVGVAIASIAQIKCGAVIIANRYVLTAAHCLYNQSPDDIAIIVGEHDVKTGDSPGTKAYRVSRFIIHPLYTSSNYDYDIALVQVAQEIQFNDYVGPVCLPFKFVNNTMVGKKLTILGWGTLFIGGPTSNVLRKVDVDVISQSQCRSAVPSVTDRQICTYTPGKDACQDDSGGPLLYTDPTTGLLYSIGIVSYGRFCAGANQPGVNTRVTALLNWIVANTQTNYCIK